MTKENLLELFHAVADKKDVEFFDSDKWILLAKGWEGMSELLFYVEEVSSNYKNYRVKLESESTQTARKTGYYWCKLYGYELIPYWNGKKWKTQGCILSFDDNYFDEIDEKQIKKE